MADLQPNDLDLVDAGMAEQLRRFRAALSRDVPRIGWKIGITTAKAQAPFGLRAPVVGRLDGERTFESGETVTLTRGARVRAEAEIALRVDTEVTADSTRTQARKAICAVGPAVELINLNMPAGDISVVLGHSIFHEAVIFGAEQPPDLMQRASSFRPVGFRNSKCVRTPEPAMVPRDLASLVLLVARTLGRCGESVKPGDRIISGSYVTPLIVEPGDRIEVDYGFLGRICVDTA